MRDAVALSSAIDAAAGHPSWIDTDIVRNAEADLPSFKEIRAKLPWSPGSS